MLLRLLAGSAGGLAEEVRPWLAWTVLDALLALAVGFAAGRFPRCRPMLEAVGWLG